MGSWTAEQMGDLSGATVVVTGANSGIGFEATREFARHGATVVMACRSVERGERARTTLLEDDPAGSLTVVELDLADLDSVRSFAESVRDSADGLDVLCNNAGVMAIPRRETADGFEMQFGVNHLGHFELTGRLLDLLRDSPGESRVVTTSSETHRGGAIDFEDLQHERSYSRWGAYAQSKLANLLFAYELQRRLDAAAASVVSTAVHPGYADTSLQRRGPEMEGSTLRLQAMRLANAVFAQSAAKGALPILYAATAQALDGGEYVGPGGLFGMRGLPEVGESSSRSRDRDLARRLWTVSEDLTGVEYDLPPSG
ncbi:oxidoreductase [Haloarculaceae archaeon H-GB2-1]|nr:oxidoreductase [Haloarculaceae archaeon H-GB1-1]MEA5387623.1 oxidoreductase [Haloarculaceae archaeon H-GB11]MEA5409111.1 oxidoreductase [Haloarculaceae archaeon H-GB2-1]